MEQDNSIHEPIGKHIIFDLYGVDSKLLNNHAFLKQIYTTGIEKCGAEIRKYQEVVFEPEGITFTFILSESHSSCHVWPNTRLNEKGNSIGEIQSDIHCCGDADPMIAVDYIIEQLQPEDYEIKKIRRGVRGV